MKNRLFLILALVVFPIGAVVLMGAGLDASKAAYTMSPTNNRYYDIGLAAPYGVFTGDLQFNQSTACAITSPSTTFDISEVYTYEIVLTSDGNLTGVYPIGGTLGRRIEIRSGAGSNTMRFDDGTSMTIGANVTLTEAQNDVLCLKCVDADGDEWMSVYAHDN